MQTVWNIANMGVNFTDSPTTCDIYKTNNSTKQPIRNEPGKTEIMEWLQFVSTGILSPVTPAARCRFMIKCFEHYTRFKGLCFILTNDKALTSLVKIVQDFVMSLELRLQHMRFNGGGEFMADYNRNYGEHASVQLAQHSRVQ